MYTRCFDDVVYTLYVLKRINKKKNTI